MQMCSMRTHCHISETDTLIAGYVFPHQHLGKGKREGGEGMEFLECSHHGRTWMAQIVWWKFASQKSKQFACRNGNQKAFHHTVFIQAAVLLTVLEMWRLHSQWKCKDYKIQEKTGDPWKKKVVKIRQNDAIYPNLVMTVFLPFCPSLMQKLHRVCTT